MTATHRQIAALLGFVVAGAACAGAVVNVELRPSFQTVGVGDTVNVDLYLAASNGGNELVGAVDLVFGWDPTYLDLIGLDHSNEPSLLRSQFLLNDLYGINESVPPQDGDGFYQAFANLGSPIVATPLGTFITTLQFDALAETAATDVVVLNAAGTPSRDTAVWDGTAPNFDITGSFSHATVEIVPEPMTLGLLMLGGMALLRRR